MGKKQKKTQKNGKDVNFFSEESSGAVELLNHVGCMSNEQCVACGPTQHADDDEPQVHE